MRLIPSWNAHLLCSLFSQWVTCGTLLWTNEFLGTISETKLRVDNNNDIYLASQVTDVTNTVKLRKLSGSNGTVLWTQAINNSELNGISYTGGPTDGIILATTTGMFAYNTTGTLIWSNSFDFTGSQAPDPIFR